jgi:hypothetical protein
MPPSVANNLYTRIAEPVAAALLIFLVKDVGGSALYWAA